MYSNKPTIDPTIGSVLLPAASSSTSIRSMVEAGVQMSFEVLLQVIRAKEAVGGMMHAEGLPDESDSDIEGMPIRDGSPCVPFHPHPSD
jgi:hypothetical protein